MIPEAERRGMKKVPTSVCMHYTSGRCTPSCSTPCPRSPRHSALNPQRSTRRWMRNPIRTRLGRCPYRSRPSGFDRLSRLAWLDRKNGNAGQFVELAYLLQTLVGGDADFAGAAQHGPVSRVGHPLVLPGTGPHGNRNNLLQLLIELIEPGSLLALGELAQPDTSLGQSAGTSADSPVRLDSSTST